MCLVLGGLKGRGVRGVQLMEKFLIWVSVGGSKQESERSKREVGNHKRRYAGTGEERKDLSSKEEQGGKGGSLFCLKLQVWGEGDIWKTLVGRFLL